MRQFHNAEYWCCTNKDQGARSHCDEIVECRVDNYFLKTLFPQTHFDVRIAGEDATDSAAVWKKIGGSWEGGDLFLTPK